MMNRNSIAFTHAERTSLMAWRLLIIVALLGAGPAPALMMRHAPTSGAGLLPGIVESRGLQGADLTVTRGAEVQAGSAPQGLSAGEWAHLQDLLREVQYQFAWQERDGVWAYRAPGPAHNLDLSLGTGGLRAVRANAQGEALWDLGLSLVAYGDQTFPATIAEDDLSGRRERVEVRWSSDVVEWYVNSSAGLEHGLTLAAAPAGAAGSTVALNFALRGSLMPELDGTGRGLNLTDARGQTVLRYDKLSVYDATGRSLPAWLSLPRGGTGDGQALQITIDTRGAAYPLTVDPLLHIQTAKLTASDAEDDDQFGYSVGLSGDTVVVGARFEDGAGSDRGAAYLYERNQGGEDNWGEVIKLTASDAEDSDYFGSSVAISGDTVVVGAYFEDGAGNNRGAAYLYERNQGGADNWGQVIKLTASDAEDGDRLGNSVAISGDTVIVGSYLEDGAEGLNRGAAYLYERNHGGADNWGEVIKLTASDAEDGDRLGSSVAVSGDTVIVGASYEDGAGSNRGAAYLYERNEGGADNWGEVIKLTASDAEDGDQFGYSVADSGDTVVVGAYYEDGAGLDRGAAYLFERNQGGADNWGQVIKLTASDAADSDWFGYSVGISGDTVIVGSYLEDGAGVLNRGAAYVYERNQGGVDNWGQVSKLTASDAEDNDILGSAVGLSGDTVVVGADGEDDAGLDRGAAYIFVMQPYRSYLPLVVRN